MHDTSKYQKLSDRDHVLIRPQMYVGSINAKDSTEYIFSNDKFELKEVQYVPAMLKIINEILDNSIDEAVRTKYEYATKISIDITDISVEIQDNGRGIPIEIMNGTDQYIPQVLFCHAKSGSNFDDDDRKTIGTNGVGSFISNVFSKKFKVTTYDGKNRFVLNCVNNNETQSYTITPMVRNGTTVYFEPDLARFNLSTIEPIYKELIYSRLVFLSYMHPQIHFSFNGSKVQKSNDKKFISYFIDEYELFSTDDYTIACGISDTDDFRFLSYVNGLYMPKGGNHINFISNEIVNGVRSKLERRYKNIKPGDIRNKLYVFAFFKNFNNMKFDSQTKELLSNSLGEIREYLDNDLAKFVKSITKNESIMYHIEENYKIKEEFQQRKELASVVKSAKRVKIAKYMPPIEVQKYIALAEGDSAVGGISAILGRKEFGYFPLKGKPLNVFETPLSRILANEEIKNIIAILGIDISKTVTDMTYENILITTDADLDGLTIRGLLITFFNQFAPDLIKQGRVKYLNTPIMYTKGKDGLPNKWVYDIRESKSLEGHVFYSKGLGSWKKQDLQHIIKIDGLNNMIKTFEYDEDTEKYINLWMGNSADLRKEQLNGLSFFYDSV